MGDGRNLRDRPRFSISADNQRGEGLASDVSRIRRLWADHANAHTIHIVLGRVEYTSCCSSTQDAGPFRMIPHGVISFANADAASRNHLVIIASVTALFGLIDLIWLPFSTVNFSPRNWIDIGKVAMVLSASWMASAISLHRLRSDRSPIANVIKYLCGCLRIVVVSAAAFIPLAISTTVFMYLASATSRPLADPILASIDSALGFDWQWFLATTNKPITASVLVFAYHALAFQMPLVLLLHAVSDRQDRALEFVALLAVSSVFTGAMMALAPAEGAYAYFKPARGLFSNFTADAGMWHHHVLMALRSGEPFGLIMTKGTGLVTFPSFHTALGLIVVYAARDIRTLFVVLALLNAAMVVATLPEGGHHLIDVVAGTVIGVLSIIAIKIPSYVRRKADSVARSAVRSEAGR
ncbi:MAG: phosphatase PAP2 family protein [Mesorhizobium sp.]|nr:MAG: phosphatase PAP2 family protein [Mesorhizobium sp.]